MTREFSRIGVVGLGSIGSGIMEVLAGAGIQVVAVEADQASLERGMSALRTSTDRAVGRGKMTPEHRSALLARVHPTTEHVKLAQCELVLESIFEKLDAKRALFAELDKICPAETIFATNTSALSVTELAALTKRPSRFVGIHFFNPAPVMGLVEVIQTVVTDPAVVRDVETLVQHIGKIKVTAGDRAGFIANALLFPYLNSAIRMFEARYASREDIDAAMRFGAGHPMGPLTLLDLIGLDTAYLVLDTMYHQTRDHLHAPAPLLKHLVTAGLYGRKSGRGFYTYAAPHSGKVVDVGGASGPPLEMARPVNTVGVVGTGTMAGGIVEVCARAGYDVVFRARGEDKVAAVRKRLEASLEKAVQRGRLGEDERVATLARTTGTTELDDLRDCDLIVEAVIEDLGVKRALFAALDDIAKPGAVLATTTSSLPIVECAAATSRPTDVLGMHWFNPVPVMKLVEVVPTIVTTDDATATAREVSVRAGKHPVTCADRAGMIVNALLFPYLNDAARMLEAHYATVDDIDAAMKHGCGHPMGPFELMDVVGLDVSLVIQDTLYREFREPGYAPAPLLEHLVTAGYLGRKTRRGFRDYSAGR